MGIFLVFVALIVLGVVMIIAGYHWYNDGMVIGGGALSILCGIVVVIMLFCLSTLETDFAYYEDQYNNLKEQVEYVEHDDIVTSENLRNQVLKVNNDISKHKRYSQNILVGMWYSERLGNLEPLKLKSSKK